MAMMLGVQAGEKVGGGFVAGFGQLAAPAHEQAVAETAKHADDQHGTRSARAQPARGGTEDLRTQPIAWSVGQSLGAMFSLICQPAPIQTFASLEEFSAPRSRRLGCFANLARGNDVIASGGGWRRFEPFHLCQRGKHPSADAFPLERIHRDDVAFFTNHHARTETVMMSAAAPRQEHEPRRQHPRHSDPGRNMETGVGNAGHARQKQSRHGAEAGDHAPRAPVPNQFLAGFSCPHICQRGCIFLILKYHAGGKCL